VGARSVDLRRSCLVLVLLGLALGACGRGIADPSGSDPGATAGSTAGLTPVPTDPSTLEPTPVEPVEYSPPEPKCPGPAVALEAPRLVVSVGTESWPVTMASSGVRTCTTSQVNDAPFTDPTVPLTIIAGESVHFVLPDGWHFLHWSGWDRPPNTEGANVFPGATTPERPAFVDVPLPSRSGDSILGIEAWVISDDERSIAGISGAILVRLP